jgi:hypothetical protein
VLVPALPADIVFDVAIRLVGLPGDFATGCALQVGLTAPTFEELGTLEIDVRPRTAAPSALQGSELNHHVMARIDFQALEYGPHHLEFTLNGKAQARVNTALSVLARPGAAQAG